MAGARSVGIGAPDVVTGCESSRVPVAVTALTASHTAATATATTRQRVCSTRIDAAPRASGTAIGRRLWALHGLALTLPSTTRAAVTGITKSATSICEMPDRKSVV